MNKPLTSAEVAVSKKAKLTQLALLVRMANHQIYIFDNLEEAGSELLAVLSHPQSAFAIAAADPVLRDMGLADGNVGTAQTFFELTKDELHQFSCNCGGHISNESMAARIEDIAARA